MIRLKFYGLGGQGIVTAARILSTAVSLHENRFSKTIPAFGHERRGAPVHADVMIDEDRILQSCFVYRPDIVILFAPSVIDKGIDIGAGIHRDTILVVNSASVEELEKLKKMYPFRKIYSTDATQAALDVIGIDIPNGPMLGALSATGVVKIESVERALKDFFKSQKGELNAQAARKAFEHTNEG
jgi:2-oxoacid:acceptor oxidoreductase gamma subunit (pyruvate/2-ketoisovalerate family)